MPALPTNTTSYLSSIKSSLNAGTNFGNNLSGAAKNYLRAQDMATVLELLQDAFNSTAALTAVSGSTTTVVDGAGTFAVNALVGQKVLFSGNTTAALAGVTGIVAGNTATTITFTGPLVAAVATGDTYTIVGAVFDSAIASLRQGKAFAEAPPGDTYGDAKVVRDALIRQLERMGTPAAQTLVFSGVGVDTQTVVVGTKTYTLQTTLTNVNGNVFIGANPAATIVNLASAINLDPAGAGTLYATAMTANTAKVTAVATSATVLTVTANVAGVAGNLIAVAETCTNALWTGGAVFLAGGVDAGSLGEKTLSWAGMKCGTGSTDTIIVADITMAIDQFRGKKCTISSAARTVVSNTETTLTLDRALASAPAANVAISISEPLNDTMAPSIRFNVAPGGHLHGDNYVLADLIDRVQTAITAYVLPV